jgi:hypothetical protein
MNKKRKAFYEREGGCPTHPHCIIIDGKKYCKFGLIKSCMYQEYDPSADDQRKEYLCLCTRNCKFGYNLNKEKASSTI